MKQEDSTVDCSWVLMLYFFIKIVSEDPASTGGEMNDISVPKSFLKLSWYDTMRTNVRLARRCDCEAILQIVHESQYRTIGNDRRAFVPHDQTL